MSEHYELQFRNTAATPADPVPSWGVEGCLTALERGDLAHWTRMRDEIRADPYGPVALDIEEACELADPTLASGPAALMRLALERARHGADK